MSNGEGLQSLYPALTSNEFRDQFSEQFACIVRYGLADTIVVEGKTFDAPMQGIAELSAAEIANIYNYITSQWHPELPAVSEQQVENMLSTCSILREAHE
jgi:mono/diheme cytochrome c family protein